jgi:hypothetical protein
MRLSTGLSMGCAGEEMAWATRVTAQSVHQCGSPATPFKTCVIHTRRPHAVCFWIVLASAWAVLSPRHPNECLPPLLLTYPNLFNSEMVQHRGPSSSGKYVGNSGGQSKGTIALPRGGAALCLQELLPRLGSLALSDCSATNAD